MKWWLSLLPKSRGEWGEALLAESTDKSWRRGGIGLVAGSWWLWLTGGNTVKTILATLSVMNALMGLYLAGLFLFGDGVPGTVLGLSAGLIIQGAFTLGYLGGLFDHRAEIANHLLLAGSTLALVVGIGAMTVLAIDIVSPANSDPEYGPLAVAGLISAHAGAVIYAYAIRSDSRGEPGSPVIGTDAFPLG